MKTLFRILGTAAAVAVTGAAIVALDKILNQKDPLHVEEVEFPEEAEQDAAEAEKTAEAYAEAEAKAADDAAEQPTERESRRTIKQAAKRKVSHPQPPPSPKRNTGFSHRLAPHTHFRCHPCPLHSGAG